MLISFITGSRISKVRVTAQPCNIYDAVRREAEVPLHRTGVGQCKPFRLYETIPARELDLELRLKSEWSDARDLGLWSALLLVISGMFSSKPFPE